MNINISLPKQLSKGPRHHRLFSDMTNNRQKSSIHSEKMVATNDTVKNVSEQLDMREIDFHIENRINAFKMMKAEQIADISIDGEIPVKNIIKRMRAKMEKQIFEHLQKAIKDMHMYEQKSAQKNVHSPKELGSTIEHTQTPKTIETPAFDFQSSSQENINEFTVGSNEFTLNPKSNQEHKTKSKIEKVQIVSEFTLGPRNPTSKKIKDKIMNSKKNHL